MNKKYRAPIIVTILLFIIIIAYILTFITLLTEGYPDSMWAVIFLIMLISASVTLIYVLFKRINEIKEGKDDDYSKY